jgi:Predicted aspartyl protease
VGHTTALARVCNPHDRARCLDLELIVDAGITYTWIRRKRLESIGIRPSGTRRFRTIEGRTVEREVGEAVIECLGERATRVVVFAERDDVEVMGVEALEGLGLEVDPVTRQLRRSESMLALTALDDRP